MARFAILAVVLAVFVGCLRAHADTLTATGTINFFTGPALVDYFNHDAFTFTFEFLPEVIGPNTGGILGSSATVGDYLVTGFGGYVVGSASGYSQVSSFRYSVTGDKTGDLFPYAMEIENGVFTLSFATQVTPDVAFGVERVRGAIDSLTVTPKAPVSTPEPSSMLLLVTGLGGLLAPMLLSRREQGKATRRAAHDSDWSG